MPWLPAGWGITRGADGYFRRSSSVGLVHGQSQAAESGGPDDFGYTWEEVTPNWIDATDGTDAGLSGWSSGQATDPIPLPFSFPFYEHTYDAVYIVAPGYLAFTPGVWRDQFIIPSPAEPNNLIAPYASPLQLAESGPEGRVYYKSGGTAPNRYFVVEWYRVSSGEGEIYTFEVVLYENGDFVFQYGDAHFSGNGYFCGSFGIEDDLGYDGLANRAFCAQFPDNTAVRFYRPQPTARVKAFPPYQGRFLEPGATETFSLSVRNTGEVGEDTYEVTVASDWPVALYQSDGVTLLTDTDGDGTVDTGALSEGETTTVVVAVSAPAEAEVGAANTAQITFTSSLDQARAKTVAVQAAVPAPFAQAFTAVQNGALNLLLARPEEQRVVQAAEEDVALPAHHAVLQIPAGFFYAWMVPYMNDQGERVCEIEYLLLDHEGSLLSGPTKLADHSEITDRTCDALPAVAVAPNGQVGIAWAASYLDANGAYVSDIDFAVVDPQTGELSVGPVRLATSAGSDSTVYVSQVRIAATADSRFVVAWWRNTSTASGWQDEVVYAVVGLNGALVHAPTVLAGGFDPVLTTVGRDQVLLVYAPLDWEDDLAMAVIDHNGAILQSDLGIPDSAEGWPEDALLLPDGRVVVAWSAWTPEGNSVIRFAVLDDEFNVSAGPTTLAHPAARGADYAVSLTTDLQGHVIFSWLDGWWLRRHLYYALADSDGNLLTPPTIFWGDEEGVYAGRTGQNVTTYLTFGDVSYTHWAATWIERLYRSGITSGCGVGRYCPNTPVTRAQMAVFLERGIHGADYEPPAVEHSSFGDVGDEYWAKDWIEALYNDGITSGCGEGNYCPGAPVTRAQMAVFLLRAKHGADYEPPAVEHSRFNDVPDTSWAKDWIEELAAEGITSGCGGGNYCPNSPVTRAQMAVFLVRTFELP